MATAAARPNNARHSLRGNRISKWACFLCSGNGTSYVKLVDTRMNVVALGVVCLLVWPVVAWASRCVTYVCCAYSADEDTATEVALDRIRHAALNENENQNPK